MTTRDEGLAPPDRQVFWRWVGETARPYLGWALLALGALALFLGWFGVSGQSLTAKQLPYLVSGGLTGLALILVGTMFLATDSVHRHVARLDGLERKVDDLYALLVVESPPPAADSNADPTPDPEPAGLVALPGGTTFHRSTCALVAGKPDAGEVSAAEITARGLTPCPVCDPASQ